MAGHFGITSAGPAIGCQSMNFGTDDESLEDSANLPSALPARVPGFPRHTQSLGASRRKAGALPALDPDVIAAEIVEDLQAAFAQFAEIVSDLKR